MAEAKGLLYKWTHRLSKVCVLVGRLGFCFACLYLVWVLGSLYIDVNRCYDNDIIIYIYTNRLYTR